jgi:hypothetical protein
VSPAGIIAAVVSAVADIAGIARHAEERGAADTAHGIARRAVGLGLDLVPVETLREYLSDEDARRANAIADAAADAKFGIL